MFKYAILAIFVVFALRSAFLASRKKLPPHYLLAAFWGLMALNQLTRLPLLLVGAILCLGGYWVWTSVRRNNASRDLQKQLGVSDMEIISIERIGRDAEPQKKAKQLEQKEKERAEELAEEAYRARPNLRRLRVDVEQTSEQSFPAGENGSLVSRPGPVSVEIEMERFEWTDGIVAFRCRTFVCDSEGVEWQGESLSRTLGLLSGLYESETIPIHRWDKAPEKWVTAMKSACVVAELTELLDSREYYEVEIDGVRFEFNEKYQMPTVDLAWLADEKSWLVRAKGIYRQAREGEDDSGDMLYLPPAAWTVPAAALVVLVEPDVHVCHPEAWYDEESQRPVFSKTGRHGVAQAGVAFSPKAETV